MTKTIANREIYEDDAARQERFKDIVAKSLDVNRRSVRMSSQIFGELGSESLDLLDLAFNVEMEFRIRMPRTDLLRRAADYFGDEAILRHGVITDLGLDVIRRCMPEMDPTRLRHGLTAMEFRDMIEVGSVYRLVCRLIELKQSARCSVCASPMMDSPTDPELVCPQCGAAAPLPSGEDLLAADLARIAAELDASPSSASRVES